MEENVRVIGAFGAGVGAVGVHRRFRSDDRNRGPDRINAVVVIVVTAMDLSESSLIRVSVMLICTRLPFDRPIEFGLYITLASTTSFELCENSFLDFRRFF